MACLPNHGRVDRRPRNPRSLYLVAAELEGLLLVTVQEHGRLPVTMCERR